MSWGPVTKNGSRMRSFASVQILLGGGKLAVGDENAISHISPKASTTNNGGTMFASQSPAFSVKPAQRKRGEGAASVDACA